MRFYDNLGNIHNHYVSSVAHSVINKITGNVDKNDDDIIAELHDMNNDIKCNEESAIESCISEIREDVHSVIAELAEIIGTDGDIDKAKLITSKIIDILRYASDNYPDFICDHCVDFSERLVDDVLDSADWLNQLKKSTGRSDK